MAAANGSADVVKLLLKHRVNLNLLTARRYSTPLHEAAYQGHLDIVKLLVKAGAKMDIRNNWNHTAAEVAEIRGYHEIVHWLSGEVNSR